MNCKHVAAALFGQDQHTLACNAGGIEHDRAFGPWMVFGDIEPVFVRAPALFELAKQKEAQAHVPDDGFLARVAFQESAAFRQCLFRPAETHQDSADFTGEIRHPLHRGVQRGDTLGGVCREQRLLQPVQFRKRGGEVEPRRGVIPARLGRLTERLGRGVVLPQPAISQAQVVQRRGVPRSRHGEGCLVLLRGQQRVAQIDPQQSVIRLLCFSPAQTGHRFLGPVLFRQ
jgi:hypothetical protein